MDSSIEDLKAAAHLAQSRRVRTIAIAFGAVGWSAFMAIAGWEARTFTLQRDLVDVRNAVTKLTNQQAGLVVELRGDEQHEGFIPATNRGVRAAERDVVFVAGIALSYEPERLVKPKIAAGDQLTQAFDHSISDGEKPSTAARVAITTVAVPHAK